MLTLVACLIAVRYMAPELAGGAWLGWLLVRCLTAAAIAALTFEFFRLRTLSFAPSLTEARLQALQARIRPHFLFNSLNTVRPADARRPASRRVHPRTWPICLRVHARYPRTGAAGRRGRHLPAAYCHRRAAPGRPPAGELAARRHAGRCAAALAAAATADRKRGPPWHRTAHRAGADVGAHCARRRSGAGRDPQSVVGKPTDPLWKPDGTLQRSGERLMLLWSIWRRNSRPRR
ncbi:MAG: histidine kinase [Burkholderiaceae bacterium]|nr:histidine kinase [Burkholderiaceae bacterium]